MKYLKKFLKHSDYIAWLNSEDYVTPSVAICLEDEHTHYHPFEPIPPTVDADITCVYEVEEDGRIRLYGYQNIKPSTSASYGLNNFSQMRIDGGEWIPAEMYVNLTAGRHTVDFKMIDNTLIDRGTFCEVGESYQILNEIREVTVHATTIEQIIYNAFANSNLEKVTLSGTVPPELVVWDRDALVHLELPSGVEIVLK